MCKFMSHRHMSPRLPLPLVSNSDTLRVQPQSPVSFRHLTRSFDFCSAILKIFRMPFHHCRSLHMLLPFLGIPLKLLFLGVTPIISVRFQFKIPILRKPSLLPFCLQFQPSPASAVLSQCPVFPLSQLPLPGYLSSHLDCELLESRDGVDLTQMSLFHLGMNRMFLTI